MFAGAHSRRRTISEPLLSLFVLGYHGKTETRQMDGQIDESDSGEEFSRLFPEGKKINSIYFFCVEVRPESLPEAGDQIVRKNVPDHKSDEVLVRLLQGF